MTGDARPSLATILREWGRIGITGFGGPPAHIALFRDLCVSRHSWLSAEQFEDAIAATNLLPGPGSTQLAIFCTWRLRGVRGALLGGGGAAVGATGRGHRPVGRRRRRARRRHPAGLIASSR
jgi:chromate transporter